MESNKINRIKNILVGVVFVFVLVLLGFVVFETFKEEKDLGVKEKKEEKPAVFYNDHYSYDKLFTVKTTSAWNEVEEQKSLNKSADMELYNPDLNAYFLFVPNSKKDYKNNFNNYKNTVFSQKKSEYKVNITKYNDVLIDGRTSQYIEFNYTNDKNVNTYIRSYAVETENYYGQIMIWTLASNQEKVAEEFTNLVSTFKEL